MLEHRITRDEVLQDMRSEGVGDTRKVDAVVLETNGELSVINDLEDEEFTTFDTMNDN